MVLDAWSCQILCVYLQLVNRNNMVKFVGGPAGGHVPSRNLGTKVMVAGRSMILPDSEVPYVVQKLTMGQIAAIPNLNYS